MSDDPQTPERIAERLREIADGLAAETYQRQQASVDHRCSLSGWGHLWGWQCELKMLAAALLSSDAGPLDG